jgi:hypothetical protein
MEVQPTLDAPLPTQDGGNSSDTKDPMLSMKDQRFLTSVEMLTKKTETLKSTTRTVD